MFNQTLSVYGHIPWQMEHFGEPVVCCQIGYLLDFIITQIPRVQKMSIKSVNSAVIYFIESFCKENWFFKKAYYINVCSIYLEDT